MNRAARLATLLLSVCLATLLGACNSDRLEPGEAAGMETLYIVPPVEPARYDLNVFASPAMGVRMGVYDAVLANDILRAPAPGDIDARLTTALTRQAGLRLGAELAAAIKEALQDGPYDLTDQAAEADAHLAITPLFAGYVDQPLRPYTPLLLVEISLTRRANGARLFRQRYNYGRNAYLADDVHLVPAARYSFADEDALLANAAASVDGLRAGFELVANGLAAHLAASPN